MITNYAHERSVGEVWIDTIDGAKVITVAGTGCKECAFSTFAGGACPGAVYDRHPCCAAVFQTNPLRAGSQGTTFESGDLRKNPLLIT